MDYCHNYKYESNIHENGNSKTTKPHKFVINLLQRLDLRSSNKHVALQNISIYYTYNKQQYNKTSVQ